MARKSRKGNSNIKVEAAVEKKVWRCGIYVRLSKVNSGKDDDGDSIENQKRLCLNYINERDDLSLAGFYEDNGRKGTAFNRPELNRLLDDARSGVINCVVVKDLSRFSRDYIDAGEHLEVIFPFLGVRFIAVTDGFDSLTASTDEKMMTVPLRNIINEMYAKDLSQKICTTLQKRMEKGEFLPGKVVYGYIKDPDQPYHLIPDPMTADNIRTMFKLRAEGMSYTAIARKLDETGAITPSKRKSMIEDVSSPNYVYEHWNWSMVKMYLHSTVYIGNLEFHKEPKALYRGQTARKRVSREQWIIQENVHEPLVSKELFDRVQEINQKAKAHYVKKNRGVKKEKNIYLGILKCGDCGKNMRKKQGTKYITKDGQKCRNAGFSCAGYVDTQGRECTPKTISILVLEKCLRNQFRLYAAMAADMAAYWNKPENEAVYMKKLEAVKDRLADARKSRKRIAGLKEGLYMSLQEGIVSEDEYRGMRKRYLDESNQWDREISDLKREAGKLENIRGSALEGAKVFAGHVGDGQITEEFLDTFISGIRVFEGHRIEVDFKYRDAFEQYSALIGEGCRDE